jgi:hypothetical protein
LFERRYKPVAEIIKHVTNSLHHAANFPKRRLKHLSLQQNENRAVSSQQDGGNQPSRVAAQ